MIGDASTLLDCADLGVNRYLTIPGTLNSWPSLQNGTWPRPSLPCVQRYLPVPEQSSGEKTSSDYSINISMIVSDAQVASQSCPFHLYPTGTSLPLQANGRLLKRSTSQVAANVSGQTQARRTPRMKHISPRVSM